MHLYLAKISFRSSKYIYLDIQKFLFGDAYRLIFDFRNIERVAGRPPHGCDENRCETRTDIPGKTVRLYVFRSHSFFILLWETITQFCWLEGSHVSARRDPFRFSLFRRKKNA